MASPLFLGIDGGGTRCRARLADADGKTLGEGVAGPATMRFGLATAAEAMLTAAREALAQAGLEEDVFARTYVGIGLAGTGHPGARAELEGWAHPFAGAWFEGDGYLAMLGAFNGGDGGVVVVGTGSIGVYWREHTVRVGGYGFPISDEGSGADIGLHAIRRALRTLDGRAPPSAFSREVLAAAGEDAPGVVSWMDHASATDYATLAPIVTRHAKAGDIDAMTIMQVAGAAIADLVMGLSKAGAPQVALVGGLSEITREWMPGDTGETCARPMSDAMAGGILLARRKSGL